MKISLKELVLFAILGTVMYVSKLVMEILPNIHLIGVFVTAFTFVFRKKALYPIYVFVFLTGLFSGFATWWIPYIYIWTLLWAAVMLVPNKDLTKTKALVLIGICSLHGFLYGVLYSPAQALLYGLDFKQTLLWIASGFYFDLAHGISNMLCGLLIIPIILALKKGYQLWKN